MSFTIIFSSCYSPGRGSEDIEETLDGLLLLVFDKTLLEELLECCKLLPHLRSIISKGNKASFMVMVLFMNIAEVVLQYWGGGGWVLFLFIWDVILSVIGSFVVQYLISDVLHCHGDRGQNVVIDSLLHCLILDRHTSGQARHRLSISWTSGMSLSGSSSFNEVGVTKPHWLKQFLMMSGITKHEQTIIPMMHLAAYGPSKKREWTNRDCVILHTYIYQA